VNSRLQKLLLPLLASLALSGCFVFDEIQRGIDLMDEHSAASAKKPKKPEPASAPASESSLPELKNQLAQWWNNALEEEPPLSDPSDGIVRCDVRGTVSFTRKSECAVRGGRVMSR
jgi:hypothetical protein